MEKEALLQQIKGGLWDGVFITENKEWPTNAGLGGVYLMERVKEVLCGVLPGQAKEAAL